MRSLRRQSSSDVCNFVCVFLYVYKYFFLVWSITVFICYSIISEGMVKWSLSTGVCKFSDGQISYSCYVKKKLNHHMIKLNIKKMYYVYYEGNKDIRLKDTMEKLAVVS